MALKFVSVSETLPLIFARLKPVFLKINGRLDALEARNVITVDTSVAYDVTQTSGAAFNAGSFTLSKGEYLVVLTGRWAANANGYRQIWLSDSASGNSLRWNTLTSVRAVDGAITNVQMTALLQVTAASATFYVVANQNSGSSLTLNVRRAITKIA